MKMSVKKTHIHQSTEWRFNLFCTPQKEGLGLRGHLTIPSTWQLPFSRNGRNSCTADETALITLWHMTHSMAAGYSFGEFCQLVKETVECIVFRAVETHFKRPRSFRFLKNLTS